MLVICSGNICRSPMAAVMLGDLLTQAGVSARVRSAGFLTEDRPASEHGVTLMRKRGLDLGEHRSQRLTAEHLDTADLVLCMERAHVREAAVLAPGAFARTFTLPELARTARAVGPRREDETVQQWIDRVGAGRRPADLVADRPDDEVADPYGGTKRQYRRTAEELDALLRTVVEHLYPSGYGAAAAN